MTFAEETASGDRKIDIEAVIEASRLTPFQWLLLAICFVIAVLDGFDLAVVGSLAPSIGQEWSLAAGQLANMFGAGLVGLSLGALLFGPLADRFGRRPLLILAVAGFGATTLVCGHTTSFRTLVGLRFAAGLCLGGALPTALTILVEFVPSRMRFTVLAAFTCGTSVGSALSGIVASWLLTTPDGWRHTLILGGVLPLMIIPLILIVVPESPSFLLGRGNGHERVARTLRRIDPGIPAVNPVFVIAAEQPRSPLLALFAPGLRSTTLLIWSCQIAAMLVFYFLTSWLPSVIHSAGVTISASALLTAMFPLGTTVGGLTLGFLMDRLNPFWVLFASLLFAACFIMLIGQMPDRGGVLAWVILGAGFGIGGTIMGLSAIAASFYPAAIRGTGVSWSLGIGRLGSIAGSMLGGTLLALHLDVESIFIVIALPALLSAGGMFILARMAAARGHLHFGNMVGQA